MEKFPKEVSHEFMNGQEAYREDKDKKTGVGRSQLLSSF